MNCTRNAPFVVNVFDPYSHYITWKATKRDACGNVPEKRVQRPPTPNIHHGSDSGIDHMDSSDAGCSLLPEEQGFLWAATGQKYAQQPAAGHQCAWSTSEKFYLLIYDAETFLWGCCCCYRLSKAEEDEGKVKNGQKFSRERDDDIAVRGDTINLSTQRMI